jgi:hypothetical protein
LSGNVTGCTFSNDAVNRPNITTRTDSGFYEHNAAATVNGWPINSNTWMHMIACTHSNKANYYSMQIAASFFNNTDLYYRSTNGSGTTAWSKIWNSANDGAGTGLDADLWDGYHRPINFGLNGGTVPYQANINADTVYTVGESRFINPSGSTNIPDLTSHCYLTLIAGGDNASRGVQLFSTQTNMWFREFTNKTWRKFWTDTNDGAGSGLDADLLDGVDSLTYSASLRANKNITGGGTITVDASGNVLWSSRFIVISNGRGAYFGTSGYFDITCPTSGTITGVGGAANKTATTAGIPLAAWEALYYILPIGSTNGSLAANFRVASYTANADIPHNWVLICVRNGDNGVFKFTNGITLRVGQSIVTGTYDSRRANFADQLTTTRTIWGQNFNGSANITGNLSSVGNITGSGAVTIASGGTDQNVTVTTSGTGSIILDTGTSGGTVQLKGGVSGTQIYNAANTFYTNINVQALTANRTLTLADGNTTLVTGTMVATSGDQTISGTKTFNGLINASGSTGAINVNTSGTAKLSVVCDGTNNSAGNAAYMTFHRPGAYAVRMGLDTDNRIKVGGWSLGNVAYPVVLGDKSDEPSNLWIRNTSPTIYLRDTDHNVAMLHCNSNTFFILRGETDATTWTQVNGVWPLQINLTNNNATFGGTVTAPTFSGALSGNASTATTATNCSRQILSGNGMNFTGGQLNADRTITLGTPSTITGSTTNSVTTSSHTHALTVDLGVTERAAAGPIITCSAGTNATIPTASDTVSGVVTTGNQTWAGIKTFNDDTRFNTSSTEPGNGNTITGAAIRSVGAMYISRGEDPPALFVNKNSNSQAVRFLRSGTSVGNISVTASNTSYNTSSDYRLKENVVDLDGAIDRLKLLPVHRFNFIADPDTVVDGFIAHEAAEVVPECVTGTKDEVDEDGNPQYQGIDQSKLVPLLTAALKESVAKIEALEARLIAAGI